MFERAWGKLLCVEVELQVGRMGSLVCDTQLMLLTVRCAKLEPCSGDSSIQVPKEESRTWRLPACWPLVSVANGWIEAG